MQLNPRSLFRDFAASLVAVLLWLPLGAGNPVENARESGISQAPAATLALPSVPVRLGNASDADARSQLARDISHWFVAIPENSTTSWRVVSSGSAPAGNGRASGDILALTFPYYATAPPSLRG